MRLLCKVCVFLVSLAVFIPNSYAKEAETRKKLSEDYITDFVYVSGASFKSIVTELTDFNFGSIEQVTIRQSPVRGKKRNDIVYKDEKMLEELNELLGFIPEDCHEEWIERFSSQDEATARRHSRSYSKRRQRCIAEKDAAI